MLSAQRDQLITTSPTTTSQLAMELPTKYDLVFNAKTAKTLGLTIPQSLRVLADRIVE